MLESFFHLMILICFVLFSFLSFSHSINRRLFVWSPPHICVCVCVFVSKIVANFHQVWHHHSLYVRHSLYKYFQSIWQIAANRRRVKRKCATCFFHDVYSLSFYNTCSTFFMLFVLSNISQNSLFYFTCTKHWWESIELCRQFHRQFSIFINMLHIS